MFVHRPFYAALGAGAGHLAWQIRSVDLDSPADCARKFVSNQWFGALIFGGIVLGKLLASEEDSNAVGSDPAAA
jgi:4-hydroxybenzoate polyprenyltransferase